MSREVVYLLSKQIESNNSIEETQTLTRWEDPTIEQLEKENKRLKEEYIMLQNASDQIEDGLREENKKLQQERDKYKNIVEEINGMIFNSDLYIHYDKNIEDYYIYSGDLMDAYKRLLEELEKGE